MGRRLSIVFDPDWKPAPMTWWQRFRLRFKRTYIGVDWGHGHDYGAKCYFKRLGGKIHVIRWEMIERGADNG